MASSAVLSLLLLLVSAAVPTVTLGKEFIVGDDAGWRLGFDYKSWAKGKDFRTGDTLRFKYPIGAHNVHRLSNGTAFDYCVKLPVNEALTSGDDVITLAMPGRKWYICGVGKHCENGMKLAIRVKRNRAPAPVPVPGYKGKEFIVGDGAGWRLGFDYQAWAKGKEFRVGDKLVFKYPVGAHNVHRVSNGTAFQNCVRPPAFKALTTGNDVIVLATPGTKWYFCGVDKHCEYGMKLVITVKP